MHISTINKYEIISLKKIKKENMGGFGTNKDKGNEI